MVRRAAQLLLCCSCCVVLAQARTPGAGGRGVGAGTGGLSNPGGRWHRGREGRRGSAVAKEGDEGRETITTVAAELNQLRGGASKTPRSLSEADEAAVDRLARSFSGEGEGSTNEERSPLNRITKGLPKALAMSQLEQELEDLNVMLKFDGWVERLVLAMPLTEQFDPPVGDFSHGHIQQGDKISLPKSILNEMQRRRYDFPYQFELQRVSRVGTPEDPKYVNVDLPHATSKNMPSSKELPQRSKVFCSILDYRAPEQYVFLPDWMMRTLRLKPRDVVRLKYRKLPMGGQLKFQPHTGDFLKLANHNAVLETELKHFSCVTLGSTISFIYNNKEYKMNVVQCLDSDGKEQEGVCVQDADVATDFAPPLDAPPPRLGKSRKAGEEGEEEDEDEDDNDEEDDDDEEEEEEED